MAKLEEYVAQAVARIESATEEELLLLIDEFDQKYFKCVDFNAPVTVHNANCAHEFDRLRTLANVKYDELY